MYLFILTIGIVLFPQAHTLNCYACLNGSTPCNPMQCQTKTNQCGALRIISFNGKSKVMDILNKSCVSSEQCIEGSIDFGVDKTVITSKCCNSDKCNDNAPEAPKTKPNGKKCYRCDGQSDCRGTLNCEGAEDRCVEATVTSGGKTETKKGCATSSLCSADGKARIPGLSAVTCCEGDYCNGADGASASFLLLATMLISNFFFSI